MDFDRSALRHRLTVAPFDIGTFDAFVRTDSGTVEHYWHEGDGVFFGPETLEGGFTSEPVAVSSGGASGSGLHLIGRNGGGLVDWRWDGAPGLRLLGPPTKVDLPGWCMNDPTVVHDNGVLQVFATRLDGVVRRWQLTPDGWIGPETVTGGSSKITAIRRMPGVFDVFSISGGLQHGTNDQGQWRGETRSATGTFGTPTAASYEPSRLDVFAARSDGVPVHWGFNGARWFDEELVLSLTAGAATPIAVTDQLKLVTFGDERLMIFARSTTRELVVWTLQPPTHWSGPNVLSSGIRSFDAWSLADQQVEGVTRRQDGTFTHWFFENDPDQGMGEPVAGSWVDTHLEPAEPERPAGAPMPPPTKPDVLLARPLDLALLGVRWEEFDVLAGPPAELVARAGAEITLVFPPQHVVEEVVPAAGPVVPGLPLEQTGGIPTWRAALAGTSRVVVSIPAGTHVPLTAEGLLGAVRVGRLVPSVGVGDEKTAIELPYGLLISPHTVDGSGIELTHPVIPAPAAAGSIGLWQTTIAVVGTPPGAPAGIALRALTARHGDPFEVPLRRGARGRIVLEPPTARIDRLCLSSLGGSLQAAGAWEGFSWEHTTALGRDRRVRTAVEGVLYPFGHRAEYIEVTERVFESGAQGAIAHLRKATTLRIIEPVRREAPDATHPAFPFAEVEFERTAFEGVFASWKMKEFQTPEVAGLEMASAQAEDEARQIREQLFGDMVDGTVLLEELAAGNAEGADDLLDPEDPESGTRQSAAQRCLGMLLFGEQFQEKIAALEDAGTVTVEQFFVPRPARDAPPIEFPVRLGGRLGDVHVLVPVVFVADTRLRSSLLHPEYSTLEDPAVLTQVADTYRDEGDGVVDVGGARIDLVRSSEPKDGDVFEVQRLHLAGEQHDGRFRPRLGAPVLASEQAAPAPDRWAFETVLPSVRALLGRDQPLQFAFTRAFLQHAPDGGIPFQVPAGAPELKTDFAHDSSRSGGFLAPDIVADGLSREHGPVNVAGILDAAADGALNPRKVLAQGATLLGYTLADLIDEDLLKDPPAILRGVSAAGTPVVTLTWKEVALNTEPKPGRRERAEGDHSDSFLTNPASKLTLEVTIGAEGQKVQCTVDQIALALPGREEGKKLIEVTLGQVVFTQQNGHAPDLKLSGVGAEFFGILKLLKKLQEAVDLGGAAPAVTASSNGISAAYTLPVPDVATGAFQLTGLVFHGGLDVPFDDRPVTLSLGFASREKPFNLSVLVFGGGGYVEVEIDKTGLRRLELALEFGASVAVDFVVARGEVHALGGVRILKDGDKFALAGYLRFGGSVSVLGLVTASIEVLVELTYDGERNEMSGRATLVLEIDLTLVSESVEIDSGRWVIAGGDDAEVLDRARAIPTGDPGRAALLDDWVRYRSAFADQPA